jgi:hypothetical protein
MKYKNGYPQVYYTFLNNVVLQGHQDTICPFPISSTEAIHVFNFYNIKANLIYIDAAHEYNAVTADITNYWNILLEGGYIFGDDYSSEWEGVKQAVDEFAVKSQRSATINGIVWSLMK